MVLYNLGDNTVFPRVFACKPKLPAPVGNGVFQPQIVVDIYPDFITDRFGNPPFLFQLFPRYVIPLGTDE